MACFACYLFVTLSNTILLAPYIPVINTCDQSPSSHTSAILGVFTMTKCMEGVRAALPLWFINECQCYTEEQNAGGGLGIGLCYHYHV